MTLNYCHSRVFFRHFSFLIRRSIDLLKFLAWLFLFAGGCLAAVSPAVWAAEQSRQCAPHIAQWLDPGSGEVLAPPALLDRLAKTKIVLLGEAHTNAAHHHWQHYLLAALHSRRPEMVLGLEMLPRRVQAALDDWSAGRLDEAAFLRASEWDELWGYDASLYLPLLQFAKLNRVPTVALNIDRKLISRVAQQGWQSLPVSERMGLSDPAPASEEYRRSLAELYVYKLRMFRHDESDAGSDDAAELAEVLQSEAFDHFVDAQLTWDRAMAEALAEAHRLQSGMQVVGIVGRGHLEYGYGIPHQLADLGIEDVAVLLPLDADDDCADLPPNLADAVFVVDAQVDVAEDPRPRLGVMIEDGDAGVGVMEVVDGSVAENTGLRVGDIIMRAAGFDTATTAALIEVVQRQAAGTWLPLQIIRDGTEMELIARFPQQFD
jgi:uncharacterized iron-regulated protein